MRNSILNKVHKKIFLKDSLKILIFWKILNFDKNRDNGNVFHFFPNFKSKVCSQDFTTNKLGVDFLSDLIIFYYYF